MSGREPLPSALNLTPFTAYRWSTSTSSALRPRCLECGQSDLFEAAE